MYDESSQLYGGFMNVDSFFEYVVHLDNFTPDELHELLDFEGIEDLSDESSSRKIAVEALGSFLMGNSDYPTMLYKRLENFRRILFVDTWFSVIKEPETLQKMGRYFAYDLINIPSIRYHPLSLEIYGFIKDCFEHRYYSYDGDEHSYTNPIPLNLHAPADDITTNMCVYLRVLAPDRIEFAIETWHGKYSQRSKFQEEPELFLGRVMRWYPNTDIYYCEQKQAQLDELDAELGNKQQTQIKRLKI